MDHAGLLTGFAFAEQSVEPGEAIGMDRAGIACKMVGGVLALSINAELIPGAWWRCPAPRAFVPDITPKPGRFGFCRVSAHLQFYGSIVCKQGWPRPDQFADMLGQRLQQGRCAPDPVAERRAVQINPFAGVYLGLPLKRQVIAVFANQHVRHEARPGSPALDQARWQWGLGESFTASAGHARADEAAHDEVTRDVIQLLGDILANLAQGAAASSACLTG